MKKGNSLAVKMFIAMLLGLVFGMGFLVLRENLISNGNTELWTTIHSILFQDITAEGATNAIGIFYIIGQLFVNALQIIIVPMVFTSIVLAMCRITDTKKLGRISYKTLLTFLMSSVLGLVLAGIVGMAVYKAGLFNITSDLGLEATSGTTGANPLAILVNVIPNNLITALSSNGRILSVVFIAAVIGYLINTSNGKISVFKTLCEEINSLITRFLTFVISKFGPLAIFCLLTRTFANYGVTHLKPALVYVITCVICLLFFLFVGYSFIVWAFTKLNPFTFMKKIMKVAVFGFSTSSSAAALPLNTETTVDEIGVSDEVASFALPLGMTINMDGTAIMQVIAGIFIAACAGYDITFANVIVIGVLALVASIGTPAAPGAGAIILFTVLSGMGYTNEAAIMAYSLILAINRPIEMLVTALNVVGDSAASLIVAKSEGMLDEEQYNKQ